MVHGDKRPHLVALIVPDPDFVRGWTDAREQDGDTLRDDPAFLAAIRAAIDRVSADLSVMEKVRRFALADEPFSIDNGELTPSMKIRRHAIRARYQGRLDALYKG
jgi:long-chain acyl-CoA synthetase